MADSSGIEWTDATWNPTTGCDRTSPGCDGCYALSMARRLKAMGVPEYQTDGRPETSGPGFGFAMHEHRLDQPLHWARARRVFVDSMSNLFHPRATTSFLADVFAVMATNLLSDKDTHTFQVLTKRPKRMRSLLNSDTFRNDVATRAAARFEPDRRDTIRAGVRFNWPLPNVWLGVSVEDQQHADERIPELLTANASLRFLSCEPLLGPVDLTSFGTFYGGDPREDTWPLLDWVIVGGESGPGARLMDPAWAQALRDQCADGSIPFFFKQTGTQLARRWGLPGKGHDPADWREPWPQETPNA